MSFPMGMAVIIKPTYACNASCEYCQVHKLGAFFKPMSKETFSLIEKKLDLFFKSLSKTKKAKITFYWLGGEPTLMSEDFFENVYEVTKNSEQNITHKIQTNLTLFHKKELKNLKRVLRDFSGESLKSYAISTSIDPVSGARVLKNQKSYDKEFFKSLIHIKKEGATYHAVYTVHKDSLHKEKIIYYFFKRLGFSGFNLNAICDYESGFRDEKKIGMTPREYGEFLIRMWDVWERDDFSMYIIPFYSWKLLRDKKDSSKLRCFNNGRCNSTLCAIGPNGDLFTCDRAMQAKQAPLGNILKDDIKKMFEKKVHVDRVRYLKENDCAGCKWWEYCKGSCPYESRAEYEGGFGKSYWCEGYKMLFEHIHK